MAKKHAKSSNADENVVAAKEAAEDALVKAGRALDVMQRRIDQQDEELEALRTALETEQRLRVSEAKAADDAYNRDVSALQAKLDGANEKLRKVQATLA